MIREELAQAADDLDAAADVIDQFGWCQHAIATADGRVCAEGAILSAITGIEPKYNDRLTGHHRPRWVEAASALQQYLRERQPQAWNGPRQIHRWNDQPSMTRDEVTDALRRAAKSIREKLGGAA